MTLSITLSYFHAFLVDLELEVQHWSGFDRTQFVNVNGLTSERHVLKFGVPQGSVLGPLLYSMYTSPLSDIACKHELSFHFYADDKQLYVTFETSSLNDMELSKCKLEACVREIDTWMLLNRSKN